MSQIIVDYEALADMAQALLRVKAGFDGVEGTTRAAGDYLGSSRVSHAVEDFGRNWSDKRKEISTLLRQVADAAADAARTYKTTEDGIVQAEKDLLAKLNGATDPNGDNQNLRPPDTDGDGSPDFRDTDSDNDGIPDRQESGMGAGAGATGTGTGTGSGVRRGPNRRRAAFRSSSAIRSSSDMSSVIDDTSIV